MTIAALHDRALCVMRHSTYEVWVLTGASCVDIETSDKHNGVEFAESLGERWIVKIQQMYEVE
jgi:hypothetical protein